MRTRSSGPAKDPITGEFFPDSPHSTIPAFIHEPVPFNPFPEAAFPTLEFPVPQPSELHGPARRIVRSNRDGLSTSSLRSFPSSVSSSQRGALGGIQLAQGVTHDARPQPQRSASAPSEMSISRNRPELLRCVSTLEPGEFKNDPYWTDNNELKCDEEQLPTRKRTYDVIPTWSSLTPGVQVIVMCEMVDSFGINNAPILLELTPEEINKYVDLQESEAQAQAAENERIKQQNDRLFQEMLAGKLDGSNSMELLDQQFSQGSIWEPVTFSMKAVDLKAGGRFLLSLGFKEESEGLWRYCGMDVSIGYDFGPSGLIAINDPPEVVSVPKAARNPVIERVKKEKKVKPKKKKLLSGSEPYTPARPPPSKLRMSISVDDILTDEPSDTEETSSVKARVARQVPAGTDLSKAVKYTKPARQWADVPDTGRDSKEQYVRKQKPKASPKKQTSYVDLTEPDPGSPVTPKEKRGRNGTFLQPPSENTWFAPVRGRSRMAAARTIMVEPLPDDGGDSGLSVLKNVAGFANPGLAAKWAKPSKLAEKPKPEETTQKPVLRLRSTQGFAINGSGKEPLAGTPPQHPDETRRPKRKTMANDELSSPFDASTPGLANNRQKWEGTTVRTRQLSIQEQYIADEDVPIEMLNAGEQILMSRPRIATRTTRRTSGLATTGEGKTGKGEGTRKNSGTATTVEGRTGKGGGTRKNSGVAAAGEGTNGKGGGTRKNSGVAATGEGRNGRGQVTRGRAAKRFYIPKSLMQDPEDEDE
ncbi:hypothetical protein VE03_04287 [Pseudogymnoascus sp. 23342-1-I1]|nr:hypothetical protein VE03_04287 [Pseudogymnoascus sp. 23342-1-I1]